MPSLVKKSLKLLRCSVNCLTCSQAETYCTSCPEEYSLVRGRCELDCPQGEYFDGSSCVPCSSNCRTCWGSESQSGNCLKCSPKCLSCESDINYCTECSQEGFYAYRGDCLTSCPAFTVLVDKTCEDCSENCLTCGPLPSDCLSCPENKVLLKGKCLEECPSGFVKSGNECKDCSDVKNCPEIYQEAQEEVQQTPSVVLNATTSERADTQYSYEKGFMPFTTVSVLSSGTIGVVNVFTSGVSFAKSAVSILSFQAAASWMLLLFYIPFNNEDYFVSRTLVAVEAFGQDGTYTAVLVLVVFGMCVQITSNLVFLLKHWRAVKSDDFTFQVWKAKHNKWVLFIELTVALFSFNLIRLLITKLCKFKIFDAAFDDKSKVIKPLIKLGYLCVFFTHIPMIVSQIIIISEYPQGEWLWGFALDSLIITLVFSALVVYDIRSLEKQLIKINYQKEFNNTKSVENHSLAQIVSPTEGKATLNQTPNFYSNKLRFLVPFRKKYISVSNKSSRHSSPILQKQKRRNSLPKSSSDSLGLEVPKLPLKKPPKSAFTSESILRKNSRTFEDSTFINEEDIATEYEIRSRVHKKAVKKPQFSNLLRVNIEDYSKEYFEVVLDPEMGTLTEEEPVDESSLKNIPE